MWPACCGGRCPALPWGRCSGQWQLQCRNQRGRHCALPTGHVRHIGGHPLHPWHSNLPAIKVPIDHDVDINATTGQSQPALGWAIQRKYYKLCEYLLSKGAQPTTGQRKIIERVGEEKRRQARKRETVNDIVSGAIRRRKKE